MNRITAVDDRLKDLARVAEAEGFKFLHRLIREWDSGEIRFDRPGEVLIGVEERGELIGVLGITRFDDVARLRRFYVRPVYRNLGIGARLLSEVERLAIDASCIELFTDNPVAARFYERRGYEKVTNKERVTHRKRMTH